MNTSKDIYEKVALNLSLEPVTVVQLKPTIGKQGILVKPGKQSKYKVNKK